MQKKRSSFSLMLSALMVIGSLLIMGGCANPIALQSSTDSSSRSVSAPLWTANTTYSVGQVVSYGNPLYTYTCRQAHTSLTGWEPPNVPALWLIGDPVSTPSVSPSVAPSATPSPSPSVAPSIAPSVAPSVTPSIAPTVTPVSTVWTPGTSYTVGQVVSYAGVAYTCRQNHTALLGWEPPNVPALWLVGGVITPTTSPSVQPSIAPSVNPTITPSVSPSSPPGILPARALMGYYHNFNNGSTCLRITDVPLSYNLIIVAFADATGVPGQVSFQVDAGLSAALGGYTQAQMIADIATVKARGQSVIISVGGQNGTISVNDASSASNFANSINSIMNTWGFQGVDIDLENGVNPTYMAQALRAVKSGSIITMAPQTIDVQSASSSYLALALNIKDILTVMNTQYYNSGSMLGADQKVYSQGTVEFMTALAVIQLKAGLSPSQIGLGLPASPSGAGSGYVNPSLINTALDSLVYGRTAGSYTPPQAYPGIRGVMDWSINWDASAGYNFANTIAPHLTTLP